MNSTALQKYQKLLQKLLDESLASGDHSVASERTNKTENEVLDEDTQPLSEMNQVIASNRNRERAASREKIVAALNKIKNHPEDYGYCDDCGDPIATKRLELMPFATLCIDCQSNKDGSTKGKTRKHLLDFDT